MSNLLTPPPDCATLRHPCSDIRMLVTPRESDIGGGFFVRRLLPMAELRAVGPFIFFDHLGAGIVATRYKAMSASTRHPASQRLNKKTREKTMRQIAIYGKVGIGSISQLELYGWVRMAGNITCFVANKQNSLAAGKPDKI